MSRRLAGLAIAAVALAIGGCRGPYGDTSIKMLLDDPGLHDRKTVRLAGEVGPSPGLLDLGAYELDDGSGSIIVVSRQNGAPRQGARVGIEGEFRSAYTLGFRTAAVILEGQRRPLSK